MSKHLLSFLASELHTIRLACHNPRPRCIADCIEAFSFNTGTGFLAMEQVFFSEWGTAGEWCRLEEIP